MEPITLSQDSEHVLRIWLTGQLDKSKGDGLTKGLVIVQTSWFILQCLARGIEQLPIMALEVLMFAFAVLNFTMYMSYKQCHWRKEWLGDKGGKRKERKRQDSSCLFLSSLLPPLSPTPPFPQPSHPYIYFFFLLFFGFKLLHTPQKVTSFAFWQFLGRKAVKISSQGRDFSSESSSSNNERYWLKFPMHGKSGRFAVCLHSTFHNLHCNQHFLIPTKKWYSSYLNTL